MTLLVAAFLCCFRSPMLNMKTSVALQVCVLAMTLLVAAFLVLLQLPGGVAPALPWAAALWAALLAATLGLQVPQFFFVIRFFSYAHAKVLHSVL